jgi:glycyl-tRNA synthetase beta chain
MAEREDLLVEIGCEELPAGSVLALAENLGEQLRHTLDAEGFAPGDVQVFATPRRIAALIASVQSQQNDRDIERRGPAVQAAFDDTGAPKPAALGFAKSVGVAVEDLERLKTDKGEWLYYKLVQPGQPLEALLPNMLEKIIAAMPMPKRMRWSDVEVDFLRPVHWVLVKHGADTLSGELMGLPFVGQTRGHRFHAPDALPISHATEYQETLLAQGKVIADFQQRRERVVAAVKADADVFGGRPVMDEDLIDEVTALVEWPVAVTGTFEAEYLDVPKEALIQTMQENQRYFPLLSDDGSLMAGFITVSNIESQQPELVRHGNERVVRPRLADAKFFWEQDQKKPLASHLEALKKVVFQQKLGTLYDKTERLVALSEHMATQLGVDVEHCKRAALLAKCDLTTEMVYEFAKMQGIAGRYYSALEGEAPDVSHALEAQYLPRHAGDDTPSDTVGQVLALADKLDTLAGIIGIGQMPSGTKDPFALRRTSLGLLRIIIERKLDLDLADLLETAKQALGDKLDAPEQVDDALDYVLERLRAYYHDAGISADVVDAVMAEKPTRPLDFDKRVHAVSAFRALPEAVSLASANKRIQNILKKVTDTLPAEADPSLMVDAAETDLHATLERVSSEVEPMFASGDYEPALKAIAQLRDAVDGFFETVMVMTDDLDQRRNRLALLSQVGALCSGVADISRLQLDA